MKYCTYPALGKKAPVFYNVEWGWGQAIFSKRHLHRKKTLNLPE
jgi:hypothetical protein